MTKSPYSILFMRKSNRTRVKTDPEFHVRKKVAAGATGAVLGAVVAGPVGALVGGLVGTAVGRAAERGKLTKLAQNTFAKTGPNKAPARLAKRHSTRNAKTRTAASSAAAKQPRSRRQRNARGSRTRR
jgi:hypothetical protein